MTIPVLREAVTAPRSRRRGVPALAAALAVVLELAVVAVIVGQQQARVLPEALATQVGHNSEAFALAALLTVLVHVRCGRGGATSSREWAVVLLVAAALVGLGLLLLSLSNPRLKTLNEAVFAAAVLAPYLALPRRSRAVAALGSVVVLTVVVVGFDTAFVTDQAESLVALVLAPIGLDLLDRGALDPGAPSTRRTLVAWLAFLLLAPVALMVLKQLSLGASADAAVFYAARGNEAFWGLFLVHALGLLRGPAVGARTARHGPRVPTTG